MARLKIDKDTEITVMNNVRGSFFYATRDRSLVLDLDEFGDTEYVTFGDLRRMMSSKRSVLEKLQLLIVDVDDDEVTVDDVVASLRLSDSYNELKSICGEEISLESIEYFIQNTDKDKIENILKSKKSKVKALLLETAVILYRKGELSDLNKLQVFSDAIGKDSSDYWKDSKIPTEFASLVEEL